MTLVRPARFSLLLLFGLLLTTVHSPAAHAWKPCLSWNCACEDKKYPSIAQFANQYGIATIADDLGTPEEHNCGVHFKWKNPQHVAALGCQQKAQEFLSAWEKNEKSLLIPPRTGFLNFSWLYNCGE
jgi:hypothetical protein